MKIVDKLFRLADQDCDGILTPDQAMEFLANLSNARPRSGIDKSNLEWLEQVFRQTVGNEKEIRRDDFKKIVISKNPFFTERVFQIFDKDNSGSISLQEFIDAMHQFAGQSPDDKIRFLFKVYDLDGDGLIQDRELQHVMRACMEENGMKFSEEQIDDLTMALFEDADADNRGAITYEALKNQLEKHGGLLENLSISIDRWLVPPKPKPPPRSLIGKLTALKPYQLSRPYMKNNYVYLIFVAVYFLINAGLFISRSIEYRNHNGYVILARACGQCLNFNCMFVLVLMLRQCITFLRTHGFSMIFPLDQHIYFHKLTGVVIFFFSVFHTIMHMLNFSVNSNNYTLYEWIMTSKPGKYGMVGGAANPTGVSLIVILMVMFICSQSFVRRGGSFEIFYWTHLLYIPFWVLVIFHAPNFWKWFVVPGVIYVVERLLRLAWMRSERGKTYISSGLLLPSRVTHLVIKRPYHFDFHPGDYVFVNVPAIAKYEWHPFTISSAPEQEDYMWLHIRGVGEWTNRLYNYFEREQDKLHNIQEDIHGLPTAIYLDGPYGAPSSHIFRSQHAVLIATGIGVTPFASILQSIMHRYWKARHMCPRCSHAWASEIPPTVMNLKKVDFFWINRDQRSFEWFVNLLSQLEIEQAELGAAMERFLEMHMYITSALQKTDMKAVGLQLALDLLHEKEKRDLITGLKTRTNAGRPNWDRVFKQIQDQKKGKVTVFYCGPPQLGRILRIKCDQFGFNFRKEVF
uniref:NADPH oxidase n=1 Tax=Timema douglasi TaxID=61478 RepID=A0A7R8ZB00_TIMDO|nr:unnamed protein product [Timema douglasi]